MPIAEDVLPELLRLYASPRKVEFVVRAHGALAVTPAAPELARLTLRCLGELGLGGPALELLQLRQDLGIGDADRAALRAACAALPNGRVPWRERDGTFRKNLAALASCRPEWGDAEPRLRGMVGRLHLHRSTQGHYLLSRREPGRLRDWLANLSTAELEADVCLPPRGKLGPVGVVGARVGPVLERIWRDTQAVGLWYSPPLYLLEPDPVCFAAWLHCADHTVWLGDERVYVLVGPDAAEQCVRLWERKPHLVLPNRLVDFGASDRVAREVQAATERTAGRGRDEFARVCLELEERYRTRNAAYWAERFRSPGPVLGVTSRFTTMLQYSTRDALAALEAQGYTTRMLLEACDHGRLRPLDLCRAILEMDPLLVIGIDHARHEVSFLPQNLPYLCWIQDALPELLCRKAGAAVGPYDLVCGYYRERCTTELGYPAERFVTTKVPVSTEIFHDGGLDAASAARYAADVCYVGHGGEPLELQVRAALGKYPQALHSHIGAVYERVRRVLSGEEAIDPQATVNEVVGVIAGDDGIGLTDFAYRLYDAGRRQQTLEWVAAWARRTGRKLRIYGQGWKTHASLAEFAAGPVEHGEALRRAYRAATLGLQLLPSGYVHQRTFEALASGCLPLTRYCPEDFARRPIEAYVAERAAGGHAGSHATIFPQLERVVFRTPAEFEELAERYLADEARRSQVLAELRAVVLRDYTYAKVMGTVMDACRTAIERCAGHVSASRD